MAFTDSAQQCIDDNYRSYKKASLQQLIVKLTVVWSRSGAPKDPVRRYRSIKCNTTDVERISWIRSDDTLEPNLLDEKTECSSSDLLRHGFRGRYTGQEDRYPAWECLSLVLGVSAWKGLMLN